MKRVVIGFSLTLAVLALFGVIAGQASRAAEPAHGLGTPAPALDAGARLNPLKIALLHWYLADTTTSVTVGSQPYGLCFDGANIWSANFNDDTVTKVQANDGQVLGTFKVGAQPYGVTFDGANVWASNELDNTVTKLRASDGKTLGTFPAGTYPGWMTFDGRNIWVPDGRTATVSKLRASDGKMLGTFPVGNAPIAA